MSSLPKRCFWVNLKNPLYVDYHDREWGRPIHEDQKLFELLILEGAQAGLSWETVLKKREHYQKLFFHFDIVKCSKISASYLERIASDPGIIRNRLKLASVPLNAKGVLQIKKEFGSFSHYLWSYVDHKPLRNKVRGKKDIPSSSPLAEEISKDLKKRGLKFVGPTIIYAFMQAIGMVNDHSATCFCSKN